MPKQRVPVTQEERIAAYEKAIHDLIGTIASMKNSATHALARPDHRSPVEVYERIIALAEGRLTRTSESLQPAYRGWRYAEGKVKEDEVPAAE